MIFPTASASEGLLGSVLLPRGRPGCAHVCSPPDRVPSATCAVAVSQAQLSATPEMAVSLFHLLSDTPAMAVSCFTFHLLMVVVWFWGHTQQLRAHSWPCIQESFLASLWGGSYRVLRIEPGRPHARQVSSLFSLSLATHSPSLSVAWACHHFVLVQILGPRWLDHTFIGGIPLSSCATGTSASCLVCCPLFLDKGSRSVSVVRGLWPVSLLCDSWSVAYVL